MTILSALTAGSPRLASTLWLSANLIVPWIPVRKLGVRSRRVACVLVPGLEDGATLCGHSCQPRPIRPLMLRSSAAKVRRTRSKEGTMELLFLGGEKIVWDGAAWHYIAVSH